MKTGIHEDYLHFVKAFMLAHKIIMFDEMLTRWMNPAAVNQVLRTIDNSLENFTELLEEERQRTAGFWQVPEQLKYLTLKILLLKVWFTALKHW